MNKIHLNSKRHLQAIDTKKAQLKVKNIRSNTSI